MSIGWVIFAIFIFLVCMGMVTLLIIASCKDDIDDEHITPEEMISKWLDSDEEDKDE